MKLTKNRLWSIIMQEADRIQEHSIDVKEMQFKLSALPANVIRLVKKLEEDENI